MHVDGKLELVHDHTTDGRGLDPERGRKVLEYVARVWRRPVTIATVDNDNRAVEIAVTPHGELTLRLQIGLQLDSSATQAAAGAVRNCFL